MKGKAKKKENMGYLVSLSVVAVISTKPGQSLDWSPERPTRAPCVLDTRIDWAEPLIFFICPAKNGSVPSSKQVVRAKNHCSVLRFGRHKKNPNYSCFNCFTLPLRFVNMAAGAAATNPHGQSQPKVDQNLILQTCGGLKIFP